MSELSKGNYIHRKSGEGYTFLEAARMEHDMSEVAIYQSHRTGAIYVRPLSEFRDKFFAMLTPPPTAATEGVECKTPGCSGEPWSYDKSGNLWCKECYPAPTAEGGVG